MSDYTHNDIIKCLKKIDLKYGDTIYCHSNIGFFGLINNFKSKNDVCEIFYNSIFETIGDEGTLIVPTYTTHIPSNNKIFDVNKSVSNMGVFAEWIRNKDKSVRTIDPFYSVAIIGKKQKEFSKNIPSNSFSDSSVFGRIYKQNAKILCFNHPGCTFLHFVERKLKISYRYDKEFNCQQIIDGKIVNKKWKIWVRYLSDKKLIHSPNKFVSKIKKESISKSSILGKGEVLTISTNDVYNVVKKGLQLDKWFLVNAEPNDPDVIIDKNYL